ncbi:hypothetical protein, partial [Mycoplasmopsis bovis]|uniref:hypothetical protein n=1 Tax=Mycoplasmopsis bovis TaxID=28903 RepID=UPI003D279E51
MKSIKLDTNENAVPYKSNLIKKVFRLKYIENSGTKLITKKKFWNIFWNLLFIFKRPVLLVVAIVQGVAQFLPQILNRK